MLTPAPGYQQREIYDTQSVKASGRVTYTAPSERSVTIDGEPVQLTPTEYRLLCELALNAGRVLTHYQLLERVWGSEYAGDRQKLLRAFVRSLRKKLGDDARVPTYILTEPRVGYRLRPADHEE